VVVGDGRARTLQLSRALTGQAPVHDVCRYTNLGISKAAFAFTGIPTVDVVVDHAACPSRDLGAAGVTPRTLNSLVMPGVCALRSAGYFTMARLRV
jgi:hypothetical protein